MRPTANFITNLNNTEISDATDTPTVQYPLVLQQAIINLLDNAQDSDQSDQPIKVVLSWQTPKNSQAVWNLSIQDHGDGIHADFNLPVEPQLSEHGLGIGLLLSHNSISRLGGSVSLNNNGQGCLTLIEMPLAHFVMYFFYQPNNVNPVDSRRRIYEDR